jgi:hypothetical protein
MIEGKISPDIAWRIIKSEYQSQIKNIISIS